MTGLDRATGREVLARHGININTTQQDNILRELESCVRPGPPHTIDRADLWNLLPGTYEDRDALRDRILALLRPVEGSVVLTREEAAIAAYALHHVGDSTAWRTPDHEALATQLAAAS